MFLKCQSETVGKFGHAEMKNRIIVGLNGPSAHAVHRVAPSPWGPRTMPGTSHFCRNSGPHQWRLCFEVRV